MNNLYPVVRAMGYFERMKIMTVIYETNTGFTEKYAKAFAEKHGLECWNTYMAKIKVKRKSDVIYFGWVQAGQIQGFKKARKRYNILAVCPVGLTEPNDERKAKLIELNSISDMQVFPLRGGYDDDKMTGAAGLLISMIRTEFEDRTKKGEELKPAEKEMYEDLQNGADYFSEDNLAAVDEWFNAI